MRLPFLTFAPKAIISPIADGEDWTADIATQSPPVSIEELDNVRLLAAVATENGRLHVGDEGIVVHRYRDGVAFEVEFVGPVEAVVTLRPGEIECIGR